MVNKITKEMIEKRSATVKATKGIAKLRDEVHSRLHILGAKYTKEQVYDVVMAFVDTVADTLRDRTRITIPGLGTFSFRDISEKKIKSLFTEGECVIPAHCRVKFRPSVNISSTLRGKKAKCKK